MKKDIVWVGFKSSDHNNIRYQELLPRLPRVKQIALSLVNLRVIGVIQYYVFTSIIFPILCLLLAKKYRYMLCTNPRYIKYFRGSILVDLDDPHLTQKEIFMLNDNHIKGIITTTNMLKTQLINAGVKKMILVIPQGIDLSTISVDRIREIGKQYKVDSGQVIGLAQPLFHLNDSALPEEYNILFLKEAMRIVWEKKKDIDLWLVGKASSTVEKWAKEESRVKLIGYVSRDDLLNWYKNFDLAVYPRTIDFKGRLSIKILEYLACGLPVVSTAVSESYMVKESRGGFVAKSKEEFSEAVIRVLTCQTLREELASSAKEYGQKYLWSKLISKYNRVINLV